jgi:poly-gamma-glutamate capsule biosynthesis protein CapA/YwtB (metallophosphatase superfamily)
MHKKTGFVILFVFAVLCCLAVVFHAPIIETFTENLVHLVHHRYPAYFRQGHAAEKPAGQNSSGGFTATRPAPRALPRELVLAATGDIMIHSPQITSAYRENENKYDFYENYFYVEPHFKKADFVVGNLETTFAGEEFGGYSGYPLFNSPPELAAVLKKSGFDLLSTANNHTLDRGPSGVLNTIDCIEEAGLDFVGTARCREEREKVYLLSKNGIRTAFLAYTYGTNGLPIPPDKDYLINLIDEGLISEDIFRAKSTYAADIIVVCIHWGLEYQRVPSDQQKELARTLIELGADIIIGNHPHVIQPAEIVETEKGSGLVFYSLGNFISNQRDRYCDTGVIAFIKIRFDPETNTYFISLSGTEPTWVHKFRQGGRWQYRILPVREVLNTAQAREIFNLSPESFQRLQEAFQETEESFCPCPPAKLTFYK